MTVYNFGSINIDLIYRVPHLVKPGETLASHSMDTVLGGKGANQSVAVAKAGARVRHVGRIGKSDQWAVKQMAELGVDVNLVEVIEGPSGHAIIQVDDSGENSIILHGGANQSFSRAVLERQFAEAGSTDWLLIQNECNDLAAVFDIAIAIGMRIAFNPAPMTADVRQLPLEHCDVLIVNETEAELLSGLTEPQEVMAELNKRYPNTQLVLTLGSKGALLQSQGKVYRQEAFNVDVVDTTGAGDTFVGYFLASLIDGLGPEDSLKKACSASALSVTKAGATPSIPAAAEVDSFQT